MIFHDLIAILFWRFSKDIQVFKDGSLSWPDVTKPGEYLIKRLYLLAGRQHLNRQSVLLQGWLSIGRKGGDAYLLLWCFARFGK